MKGEKGLTLLEVLVSMIILAVGLLALAPLVVLSIEGNNMSRDVQNVSALAKAQLENYQNPGALPALPFRQLETGLAGTYDRLTVIVDNTTDTLLPAGVAHVQVQLDWVDKVGVSRTSRYSTLVSKD
jgi:type IV pilus assembly protein PilV